MSRLHEIASAVANIRRSKPDQPRPPAEFGQRAIEIAEQLGKSRQELASAIGYDDPKTLYRLARGDGSIKAALAVRAVLVKWGADVSSLPAIVDGEADVEPAELWEREWAELGRELHRLASDERFQVEVDRIRDVIRSHKIVAEGTGEQRRRRP